MKHFVWLLAFVWVVGPLVSGAKAQDAKPNVIILIADQLRYQSVGYSGDKQAITPHIDRLASQGINFRQFVANTPVCSAFRGSLLTGKHASSTGVVVNELRLNPNHDTIAHVLKARGYKTDHIGKWHLWANKAGGHNYIPNAYTPPGPYRMGFDDYWAGYNFGHQNFNSAYFRDTAEPIKIKGFSSEHYSNLAIERINLHAKKKEPFVMTVAYSPPHDPWGKFNVPEQWYEKFKEAEFKKPATWSDKPDPRMDRNTDPVNWLKRWKPNLEEFIRVYYAMTGALDEQIGRVLKAVDDAGIADNTIVIFTSDHGEMFGAQGRVFKMTFYEESARVPFVMRWPGKIKAGSVSDASMSTVDIMPTIAGLCGGTIPKQVEGLNLGPLVLGKADAAEPPFALLQGMGHTFQWKDGFEWRALRNKQYTYARYLSDGKELLFHNAVDPIQSKDLAADPAHAAKLKELRDQMNARMAAIGDDFQKCSWYRDNWTDNRVIMRGGRGTFKWELGPTLEVDVNLMSAEKGKRISPPPPKRKKPKK